VTLADRFFDLHARGAAFVLPNVWDAASARIFEQQGFPALATSSAGLANSLGYADGEHIYVDELYAGIARIVHAVHVPVSADLEAGFGNSPDAVVATFERAAAAGAVGANIEDFDPVAGQLVPIEEQCERIRAVKARAHAIGMRFFVNARCDIVLNDIGPAETRVERSIERLQAFAAAGADGVFLPGLDDLPSIERVAAAIAVPLNILGGATTPSVAELKRAGVARVSIGSSAMRRTLALVRDIAKELRDEGTFAFARDALPAAEVNGLFLR
jgi:2-methylisocitrate lyase-like PEP mutase family enzyme